MSLKYLYFKLEYNCLWYSVLHCILVEMQWARRWCYPQHPVSSSRIPIWLIWIQPNKSQTMWGFFIYHFTFKVKPVLVTEFDLAYIYWTTLHDNHSDSCDFYEDDYYCCCSTWPKVCGFKLELSWGDGFLKAIKSTAHLPLEGK